MAMMHAGGGYPALIAAFVMLSLPGYAMAAPRPIGNVATPMSPGVARCVLRREADGAAELLRTLPGSAREAGAMRDLAPRLGACFDPYAHYVGGWLPDFDTPGLRAALVRALLQSRRDDLPSEAPVPAEPPWFSPDGAAAEAGHTEALLAVQIAECVARRHWSDALMLVRVVDPVTERGHPDAYSTESAREREEAAVERILSRLVPDVAACVPAGLRLRLNRLRLRRMVEEAVMHLATPAQKPSASGPFPSR